MPIRPYLREVSTFEPEAIRNMSIVFESVLAELGLRDKDDPATRLVASKISNSRKAASWTLQDCSH